MQNPLQSIVDDIVRDARSFKADAKRSKVVPLGQERLSAAQTRKRFEEMSEEQRRQFIGKMGVEETLKLVRG